jgi:demethylmenaquinone methyltransferase/2-methoxy-6-polyprenyl-1,4-benzoquinol methylase
MTASPLPPPERKAAYVEAMFTRIAPVYDRLNTIMTAGLHYRWRRAAVAFCNLRPGDRALDVATGTADFALELAWAVGPDGHVAALDFSAGMLEIARRKLAARSLLGRISLQRGDALHLPYRDGTFDAATIGFGGRNVTDLLRLFTEMRRVVRPGGRVVFLELSRPAHPLFWQVYRWGFCTLAPLLGAIFAGDRRAYTYLPHSLLHFPSVEEIAELMRRAGLCEVFYRQLTLGLVTVHVGTRPLPSSQATASGLYER